MFKLAARDFTYHTRIEITDRTMSGELCATDPEHLVKSARPLLIHGLHNCELKVKVKSVQSYIAALTHRLKRYCSRLVPSWTESQKGARCSSVSR